MLSFLFFFFFLGRNNLLLSQAVNKVWRWIKDRLYSLSFCEAIPCLQSSWCSWTPPPGLQSFPQALGSFQQPLVHPLLLQQSCLCCLHPEVSAEMCRIPGPLGHFQQDWWRSLPGLKPNQLRRLLAKGQLQEHRTLNPDFVFWCYTDQSGFHAERSSVRIIDF